MNEKLEIYLSQFNFLSEKEIHYSVSLFENIDSLSFKECTCDFQSLNKKSEILAKLFPAYNQALEKASSLEGFKEVIPETYQPITKEDTLSDYIFVDSDTTSEFYYKGKQKYLKPINWTDCRFLNNVQEIRKYRFEEKQIVIVNLSCSSIDTLPDEKLITNKQNFNLLETALIYTPTQWHGTSKDYLLEY